MDKINVAVVGSGYWGPNLIRNFYQIPESDIKTCCDLSHEKLSRIKQMYPHIETTTELSDILEDTSIQAVAIATPVYTHKEIASLCLKHDKHVMVEKPLASSSAQCLELIKLAEKQKKILMVGHTFEYAAAVSKAKEIVDSGEMGEIYYMNCVRANLGLFQPDINVIWDLAPHDLSILMYILGKTPASVNAQGKAHFKKDIEDVATISVNFENGVIAFLHESWLHPDKIRRITIVGSKKMLVYDDIKTNEKIKIYDKGVEVPPYYNSFADFQFAYRYGDIYIPKLKDFEPLREECKHFIDCTKTYTVPRSDGYSGLRVVSILEAANESLRNDGVRVPINYQ